MEAALGLGCELKSQGTWHLRSKCGQKLSRGCLLSSKTIRFIHNSQAAFDFFPLVCLNQEGANLCFSGGVLSIKWAYLPLFGLSLDPGLLATYVSISGPLFLVFMALIPQKGSVLCS